MEAPGPNLPLRIPRKVRVGRDCPLIIEGFEPGLVAKGTMRGQQKLSLKGQQRGSQVWGDGGVTSSSSRLNALVFASGELGFDLAKSLKLLDRCSDSCGEKAERLRNSADCRAEKTHGP